MDSIKLTQLSVREAGEEVEVLTVPMKFWFSGFTGRLLFKSLTTGQLHDRGPVPAELRKELLRPYRIVILPSTIDILLEEGEMWPFGVVLNGTLIELA